MKFPRAILAAGGARGALTRGAALGLTALVLASALGYWGVGEYRKSQLHKAVAVLVRDSSERLEAALALSPESATPQTVARIDEHAQEVDRHVMELRDMSASPDRALDAAVRKDGNIDDVRPERIEGKKVAVVAGTAHEQYLKNLFTEAEVRAYPTADAAREALKRGEVDLLFGDGFSLAFWLNGTDSGGCCAFAGGPFVESRYFGEGVGVAVKRGNDTLRLAINWALFGLWEKGRFTDLWLRYFPINPY